MTCKCTGKFKRVLKGQQKWILSSFSPISVIREFCVLWVMVLLFSLPFPFHPQVSFIFKRLPWWLSGKESLQPRRHRKCGFDPWVGKIPWRRAWQSTPVFLPGGSHGLRSLATTVHGTTESDRTEAPDHTGTNVGKGFLPSLAAAQFFFVSCRILGQMTKTVKCI